jgi:TDG/mug DNA glycosylase family protein
VAVWDVLQLCVREGSLDAAIRDEVPNDFAAFFAAHPHIRRIGLNGGKAAASFRKYAAVHMPPGAEAVVLPSTSPAHAARSLETKLSLWRAALLE